MSSKCSDVFSMLSQTTKSLPPCAFIMAVINFTPLYGVHSNEPCCAYLLEVDDVCILLDCGWTDEYNIDILKPLQRVIDRIDLVLISHPDLAHLGALPYAIGRLGLKAPIYGTLPVHKMGQISLYDAYQAKWRCDGDFNCFNLDDVDAAFENFQQLKYSEKLTLTNSGEGITITPHVAGHLIGGSLWRIVKETDEIIYAVDYNHRSEHVLQKTILDSFTRPTLLITDSMNLFSEQPKLKDRDSKIMVNILKTIRNGGNVLIPTDSAGRVLELMRVLDQHWIQNKLKDPIALLHDMSYYTPKAAQAMLEWCNERIAKNFDVGRQNPFQFSHINLIHTLEELDDFHGPKVVLTTSNSLECGYAKELFLRWAPDPKNCILFVSTPPPSSFAARVVELLEQDERVITCKITKKVFLEGAELALHEAKMRKRLRIEAENKAKELEDATMEDIMMGVEDLNSDSDEEMDQIGYSEKEAQVRGSFRFGLGHFASMKHPMFFTTEPKIEWDEYGETIRMEDYKDMALSNISARKGLPNDLDVDADMQTNDSETLTHTRPTKTVKSQLTLTVSARLCKVDFDGIADGRAIRNCLSNVKPRKLILVHGTSETTAELVRFVESSIKSCEAIFTPRAMQCIDIESDTNVYKFAIKESLYSSTKFHRVGSHEVAFVRGEVMLTEDSSFPLLQIASDTTQKYHQPMLISEGKLKLDVLKQVLGKAGYHAKFRGGMLVCDDGVVLKRSMNNEIIVEGVLSNNYFRIRKLLYEQYKVL